MKKLIGLAVILTCIAPLSAQEPQWIQLFNGRNLDGWTPKIKGYDLGANYGNTFRVENGILRVVYDPASYPQFNNRFGHLFYKQKLSDYVIAVEYRFVGEQAPNAPSWALRNSGVMIDCQPPESMGKDQDFPISLEVQLLGGNGKDERPTANMCSPGTNIEMGGKLITTHCINSTAKTYHGDQWVRVEVEVRKNHVRHIIDGKTVFEYENPQVGGGNVSGFLPEAKKDGMMLTEGWISLQSEGHPVEFRKVEMRELK
jgi:hypothetical protein